MSYAYGATSAKRLQGVHPHLVKIAEDGLARSPVDISIICGVRTVDEQIALYAQGRTTAEMRAAGVYDAAGAPKKRKVTWTLNSNHFVRPQTGFGHAIDVAPYVNGRIVWEPWSLFIGIATAFKAAARDLGLPLRWGGDWESPDGPHFELPRDYNP